MFVCLGGYLNYVLELENHHGKNGVKNLYEKIPFNLASDSVLT